MPLCLDQCFSPSWEAGGRDPFSLCPSLLSPVYLHTMSGYAGEMGGMVGERITGLKDTWHQTCLSDRLTAGSQNCGKRVKKQSGFEVFVNFYDANIPTMTYTKVPA